MENEVILVTGADGQLGQCIREVAKDSDLEFIFTGRYELDITDPDNIEAFIDKCLEKGKKITTIINCAAFTNLPMAEQEKLVAANVNIVAPMNLAVTCKLHDILLIHVSTDYVFDGMRGIPYETYDVCNPLNEYGLTKYLGEVAIARVNPMALVIRTSWLYSEFGSNFVTKVIDLAKNFRENKKEANFVLNEVSSPTYAMNLARYIVFNVLKDGGFIPGFRIAQYHDYGCASRYDFAKMIEALYFNDGVSVINADVGPAKNFDNLARPSYSVMSLNGNPWLKGKGEPMFWVDALKICIDKIKEKQD